LSKNWEQNGRQNCDDRNNDEKFNLGNRSSSCFHISPSNNEVMIATTITYIKVLIAELLALYVMVIRKWEYL